jgi:succinate-semialdehyde dehydrogenase/glutarate-semialdehyde dehydrogenase
MCFIQTDDPGEAIYDKFMEGYTKGVAALKAGDPMDPNTTLAPLSSQGAADEVL